MAVTSAAPMPQPAPQETPEEYNCIEECLQVEEECLLNSIGMSPCVIAFDDCHTKCVPIPEPAVPVVPEPTAPVVPEEEEEPNTTQDDNTDIDIDTNLNNETSTDTNNDVKNN
ncbi:hypothetical protein BGZ70_009666, partial [Mortierella alpina]